MRLLRRRHAGPVSTGRAQPRHEGRTQPWQGLWLGGTAIFGALAAACLVPAYQFGDPLIDPRHPLAEALGSFGYFFLANAFFIGLAGLTIRIRRSRHQPELDPSEE
jgi:hypothetical protein